MMTYLVRFLSLAILVFLLLACSKEIAPNVQSPTKTTLNFVVDPLKQTVTLAEPWVGNVLQAESLPSETRILVPGTDIAITELKVRFVPEANKLILTTRFKNITDDASFQQPFFFTLSEGLNTKNIVRATAPLVLNTNLGGDGKLDVGEKTSPLTFTITHNNKPFSFLVDVSAVVRITSQMRLLVGNANDNSVLEFDGETGTFLRVFVTPGSGGLSIPQNLALGPDGNLYVSSWNNGSIKRYNGVTGVFINDFVPSGRGGLLNPDHLVFGPDRNLYVSDRFRSVILRYNGTTGAFIDTFVSDGRLGGFVAFTFGPDKNIYASMFNCCGSQRVLRFNGKTGLFIDVFTKNGPPIDSAFSGLVFGPDGHLYASRFHKDRVERYNGTTGVFIDTFITRGSGGLSTPDTLTFGPDEHLYVASQNSEEVLRFDGATGAFIDVFASKAGLIPKGIGFSERP